MDFRNIINKRIDGTGLAIFRICFFLVLFFEVKQLYFFKELIYGPFGQLVPSDINLGVALWFWMPVCLMLVLGLFTRVNTILNYLFCIVFITTTRTYEYHMFHVYVGISFLVMFMPISKCLSFDRLWTKLKYSNTKFQYKPDKEVNIWHYWMPLITGIGFMYFGSVFFKFVSYYWMNGLGMWLPSSMPMATHSDLDFLLDWKFGALALGYITLVFEALFIFLFWFKPFRIPLFLLGLGLHVGIIIAFPIPWFGLGEIAILLLLLPAFLWRWISEKMKFKSPILKVYYDLECPLCVRTKIVVEHIDIFKAITFLGVQSHANEEPVLTDIPQNELLANIYSVNKIGKSFSGIDTYIQILKQSIYLFPIGLILSIPGIYHIAKYMYQYVANNRVLERCTEDNCGYTPPSVPKKDSEVKIFQNITLAQLKRPFFVFAITFSFILQIGVIYNKTPYMKKIRKSSGFYDTGLDRLLSNSLQYLTKATSAKTYFGITGHGLFIDGHFKDYNHIIAVTYINKDGEEVFLPFIDEEGNPDSYLSGPTWAKWTFRLNKPKKLNLNLVERGIRDFTAFWAAKNRLNLKRGKPRKFFVRVKKVEVPKQWEKGFKKRMEERPWLDGGHVIWHKGKFEANIKNIEKM